MTRTVPRPVSTAISPPPGSARARALYRRPTSSPPRGRRLAVGTMAGWRTAAYRLFAALLLPPDGPRLDWLAACARELRGYDDNLATFGFFGSWKCLLDTLSCTELEAVALQGEYLRLFSVNASGTPCLPYESCYVAPGGQATGWVAMQLEHTYRRAGLSLAPSLNESPDHAAVELEYMAYLCRQEVAAWERADLDEALRSLTQQRFFLRLHLDCWFGAFAQQLAVSTREPLYEQAAEAAEAFITHDRDLINALMAEVERVRRQPGARANADEGHLTE